MEYDKERLIEIVHSKPALWDKRTSQYQNRNLKQKEWKEVNEILRDNEAKEKWENTRDIFRREFNKSIKSSGQGTDETYKSKWPYYERMLFLKDVMMPRKTTSNIQKDITLIENHDDSDNPDDHIESLPENLDIPKPITPISNKRKTFQEEALEVEKKKIKLFEARLGTRIQKNLNKNNETDGDYHFLMSILPMFKKMNEIDKIDAKMEIYGTLKKYINTSSQSQINSNNYCSTSSSSYYQSPSPASLEWMQSDSRTSSIIYTDMDTMQSQSFQNN